MDINFKTEFQPHYGKAVPIASNVLRVTANNPSAFTFHGTNSYIVGSKSLCVIDPGPDDDTHLAALLKAVDKRPVSHIFVSHTHIDHSPLAIKLAQKTGAVVCAEGPHRTASPASEERKNPLDASTDRQFRPDQSLSDGQTIQGDGWALTAIHTPGHTANHLMFGLDGTGIVFSADHVMAWATTIVAPPDGSMSDYMTSLDKLIHRDDQQYFPGHGGRVEKPDKFLRGLKAHRKMRERAIVERIHRGDRTIGEIVAAIYRDIDKRLHGAAALSVLAHLEDLVARDIIQVDGEFGENAIFSLK